MEQLFNYIQESKTYASIQELFEEDTKQLVTGLAGSGRTVFEAATAASDKQVVVVTANAHQANQVYEDLSDLVPRDKLYLFPADEMIMLELSITSLEIHGERAQAMRFLLSGEPGVVVVPLTGIKRFLPPVEEFRESFLTLTTDSEIDVDTLTQRLIDYGFVRTNLTAAPGEFSVRGGIIDIYLSTEENPVRIELFDIEVDSMRYFDVETQRSLESVTEIEIGPASEHLFLEEWKRDAANPLRQAFEKEEKTYDANSQTEELDSFHSEMSRVLEALEEDEPYDNLELYSHFIYPEETTLLDYMLDTGVVFFDEFSRILENEELIQEEETVWKEQQRENGRGLADFKLMADFKEVLTSHEANHVYLTLFQSGAGLNKLTLDQIINVQYRSMLEFFSQMELLHSEVNRLLSQDYAVVVLAPTEERAEEIGEIFEEFDIKSRFADEDSPVKRGQVQIRLGQLQNGFELPHDKLAILTEKELFNKITKKKPKRLNLTNAERIKSYNELETGDYVVHVTHGIGRYLGIETMEVNGTHQDYLKIEYKKGSKLYVPVDQFDLIQKYVASEGKTPKIHTLGGSDWTKTKNRVYRQVEDIADELIALYAERETRKGHAFEPDDSYQQEFEDAFPYTETPDQERSASEIKADMEKEKPMDRLLVGDVGYGKTEVAMRAIFKAVKEGKQAAFLVPTTVLAQQHYQTLTERFEGFPIEIDVLSRFRTKKEQEETLKRLKQGKVDIVIGTHRLLSKDVKFSDLGLLIVDEEQRFGVKHKEILKNIKKDVDVLTLTATPIPRTLHMSMISVRDLSVIETPPENRYPVQTYVMEMNDGAIREAIEREMARDGQVYFLHNRVGTIQQRVASLEELVPDARIGYIHGQMPEEKLENTLIAFINGEYDVLVTTTIIETGVDVPNVNTLLIEDADRMGLSQLYQLRGRVGRSNRVAYAYMLYQPDKVLREESAKRLETLKEFTELGSGFKIAMRDLAIRGAGNLLGQQQSGFIDSVGYDLYTEMLREAVEERQGVKKEERTNLELKIPVDAYIPDAYIPDESQKIEIYKRIQRLENQEDYVLLQDDLIDRFGDYPQEVSDLLTIGLLKATGEKALIETIDYQAKRNKNEMTVTFSQSGTQQIKGEEIIEALQEIPLKVNMKNNNEKLSVVFYIDKNVSDNVWLGYLLLFSENIRTFLKGEGEKEKSEQEINEGKSLEA